MAVDILIEDQLQHVNTLQVGGKPIKTRVLSRLFLVPVYFRVQALAVSPEDFAAVEMYGKMKGRKCSPTLINHFKTAVSNTGYSISCLLDFKDDLVSRFISVDDQQEIRSELCAFLQSDKAAPIRAILAHQPKA